MLESTVKLGFLMKRSQRQHMVVILVDNLPTYLVDELKKLGFTVKYGSTGIFIGWRD